MIHNQRILLVESRSTRRVESREKLFTRRKARTFIAIINGLLCVYGASTRQRHDLTSSALHFAFQLIISFVTCASLTLNRAN